MRGNGVGPGCLFLDPNSSLFNLYHSYGSEFHIRDSKISLHKCRIDDFILLDKMYGVSPHLITAGHITTFSWKFLLLDP